MNKFIITNNEGEERGYIILGKVSREGYRFSIEVKELNIENKIIKKNEIADMCYNTSLTSGRVLVFKDKKTLPIYYGKNEDLFNYLKSFIDIY